MSSRIKVNLQVWTTSRWDRVLSYGHRPSPSGACRVKWAPQATEVALSDAWVLFACHRLQRRTPRSYDLGMTRREGPEAGTQSLNKSNGALSRSRLTQFVEAKGFLRGDIRRSAQYLH